MGGGHNVVEVVSLGGVARGWIMCISPCSIVLPIVLYIAHYTSIYAYICV